MVNAVFFSNTAVQTTLSGSISSGALSFTVGSTTGFPATFPYVLALDYGASAEELVSVTGAAGTTLTATRAYGGTSAQAHSLGAVVRHVYDATEATAYRTHEAASTGAHGVTGAVVGTTDTQTLSAKTLTSPTVNAGALSGTFTGTPTFTGNISVNNKISQSLTLSTDTAHGSLVSGDTFDRYRQYADGKLEWGPGASTRDVNLYRGGASTLQSDSLLSLSPTATGVVDYLKANAPSGASTSANLLNLLNNAGNRFSVTSTGQVSINKTGNTAGVPLLLIAETGQTGNLITAQVATGNEFSVTAAGAVNMSSGKATVDANGIFTTYANNTKTTYAPTWAGQGTATFSTNTGWYQRVGKMVMFSVKAVTSAAGSGTANVTFTLPSTPETTTDQLFLMRYGETAIGYAISFAGTVTSTVDRIRIQDGTTAGQVKNLIGSFIATGTNINVEGWYWEA